MQVKQHKQKHFFMTRKGKKELKRLKKLRRYNRQKSELFKILQL